MTRPPRSLARLLAAVGLPLLVVTTVTGCVPYGHTALPDGARFDLLHARRLAAFESRIATELHTGAIDDWTHVGAGWLGLIECRGVDAGLLTADDRTPGADRAPLNDPVARLVYAGLVLEEARRVRMIREAVYLGAGGWGQATLFSRMHRHDFFERSPDIAIPGAIRWPAEDEAWADEVPAPIDAVADCDTYRDALVAEMAAEMGAEMGAEQAPTDAAGPDTTGPEALLARAHDAELAALDRLIAEAGSLAPDALDGSVARLLWRAHLHGAMRLAAALEALERESPAGDAPDDALLDDDTLDDKTVARALRHRAIAYLEGAPRELEDAARLPGAERARLRYLHGMLLLADGRPNEALARLAEAEALELEPAYRWQARYVRLRELMRATLWDDAAAVVTRAADTSEVEDDEASIGVLPPPRSPLFGAWAYHASIALRRAGYEDRFLALAFEAFRDRPYEADPFLRALYAEVLQRLAEYPFEARTIELLEELGPRNGTFQRVEELASIALDRGRPENAAAAARWLLGRQSVAAEHPRYHAILALAAFLEDDERGFGEHLGRIVVRADHLLEVVPQYRRSNFFAHADAQLTRVLRLMLPVMAEWGESAPARARRQRWLRIIVDHTQTFLRTTPDSLARPVLVELYRLASAMLEEHPRGYAERVGARDPAPLVLGTVRVSQRDLARHEPRPQIELPPVFALVLIPRDGVAPAQWPLFWDDDATHGADR